MIRVVEILESTIKEGRRLLKFLRLGKDDVQKHLESAPFGYDGRPPEGMRAIYVETGVKGQGAVIGYINPEQMDSLGIGELRLYSTNDQGSPQAYQKFTSDGITEVNGDADNAVRYTDSEMAFNELKNDFNAHTHTGNQGAPTSVPTQPSTADWSPSKVDEVKLP